MYCSEHDGEKVSREDHPTAGRSTASHRYSSKTPVFGERDQRELLKAQAHTLKPIIFDFWGHAFSSLLPHSCFVEYFSFLISALHFYLYEDPIFY